MHKITLLKLFTLFNLTTFHVLSTQNIHKQVFYICRIQNNMYICSYMDSMEYEIVNCTYFRQSFLLSCCQLFIIIITIIMTSTTRFFYLYSVLPFSIYICAFRIYKYRTKRSGFLFYFYFSLINIPFFIILNFSAACAKCYIQHILFICHFQGHREFIIRLVCCFCS